jgi:hypothetical protein
VLICGPVHPFGCPSPHLISSALDSEEAHSISHCSDAPVAPVAGMRLERAGLALAPTRRERHSPHHKKQERRQAAMKLAIAIAAAVTLLGSVPALAQTITNVIDGLNEEGQFAGDLSNVIDALEFSGLDFALGR